jgi:hypothetical protein
MVVNSGWIRLHISPNLIPKPAIEICSRSDERNKMLKLSAKNVQLFVKEKLK